MEMLLEPQCGLPDMLLFDYDSELACHDWLDPLALSGPSNLSSVPLSIPSHGTLHGHFMELGHGSDLVDSLESSDSFLAASLDHEVAPFHSSAHARQLLPPPTSAAAGGFHPQRVAPLPHHLAAGAALQPQVGSKSSYGPLHPPSGYQHFQPQQQYHGQQYEQHRQPQPCCHPQQYYNPHLDRRVHGATFAQEALASGGGGSMFGGAAKAVGTAPWHTAGAASMPVAALRRGPPSCPSLLCCDGRLCGAYGAGAMGGTLPGSCDAHEMSRSAQEACRQAGLLSPLDAEADSLSSGGSDVDTLRGHDSPPSLYPMPPHLPPSASASQLALELSASSRRSLNSSSGSRSTAAIVGSPRRISLKVKALPSRMRPPTVAGAPGAGARPARASARRSAALSAAAAADEAEDLEAHSDSEAERDVYFVDLSEERCSERGAGKDGMVVAKKKHNPWSLTETEALVEGVRMLGVSKWAEIKKLQVCGIAALLARRSPIDLKDKWRNLTRVAKLPKSVLRARAQKTTSEVPLQLLLTVKDLMDAARE